MVEHTGQKKFNEHSGNMKGYIIEANIEGQGQGWLPIYWF